MEVLLEVVLQRHVDERPPIGGQLHARREPTLHDGEVARGEVAVEIGDVAAVGHAVAARERARVDARPGDDDEPQVRRRAGGRPGTASTTRRNEGAADARSADGDDAHPLVGAVAELGAQRIPVGEARRGRSR